MDEKLDVLDSEAEHLFSNLVTFSVSPEEVCLGLGIRDIQEENLVNIHTYLHMTIPHFLRFADAINQQIQFLIDKGIITKEPKQ